MIEITEAEVLAELQRLSMDEGSPGLTAAEWAAKLNLKPKRVNLLLTRAKAAGMLQIGRGYREGLDGRRSMVPVYTVKSKT